MKTSAITNANIALVKYWGKRNQELMLPYNSSISMTTEGVFTHTTVDFDKNYAEDIFILNKKEFKTGSEEYDKYVKRFLNFVRKISRTDLKTKIVSINNFPSAAGLASSAAGFAALATAVNKALNLDLPKKDLSMMARRGSGSATRSIFGGFVEWKKGTKEDGLDSFAEQIAPSEHWKDFRMIVGITSITEKKVRSRAGMAQTVKTSPYYKSWIESVDNDLTKVREGILTRNFKLVGETAEENCLKMHATMITTKPSIIYWNTGTIQIIQSVLQWRDEGLEVYFTIDAGPQVKILCLKKDIEEVEKRLKKIRLLEHVIITRPGGGTRIVNEHLF